LIPKSCLISPPRTAGFYGAGDKEGWKMVNIKEGKVENMKTQEAGFEKSQEGKIENMKDAGLKKSEQSEFENEIYQDNDLSKSEKSETSEIEKSGGQNEIER